MNRAVSYRLALAALVIGSLGLRLFGIGWGIPNFDPARIATSNYRNSYHLDEDNFFWGLMQMRPAQGNFDVGDYHWGTLQFYLIYGTMLTGEITGILPSPWEDAFRRGDVSALPRLYILGRLISVVAGLAGTLVVLALGTTLAGRVAGLVGGAAYAVAPLPVVEAHYLTNDVVMSVLAAGVALCAALAVRRERLGWLFAAGLLFGLAVSDKYSAIFIAPALFVAQLLVWRGARAISGHEQAVSASHSDPGWREWESGGRRISHVGIVITPWVGALLGFLVGEPYVLLAPGKMIGGLQATGQSNAADLSSGLGQIGQSLGMLGWQAKNVAGLALTWPLALLSLVGLALLVWSVGRALALRHEHLSRPLSLPRAAPSLIALAAMGGLALGLALNRIPMLRYSQPLLPLLAVAAGVGLAAIPRPPLRWAAGALALSVAGVVTLGQLSIMGDTHPANDLLAWLQDHFQPGQTVAQVWPEYPPLDGGSYKLVRLDPWNPRLPEGVRPDYVIMDNMAFAPPSPGLAELLAHDYREVARFGARPHIGPFSWEEGNTPHDWKYSHPVFIVYEVHSPSPIPHRN